MADFPVSFNMAYSDSGGKVDSGSTGTLVLSGSGAYGSYVELIASTSATSTLVLVSMDATGSTLPRALDIAVGSAGNEEVVVTKLFYDAQRGSSISAIRYLLPITIAEGSRVSAAVISAFASRDLIVAVDLFAPSFISGQSYSEVTAMGITSSTGTTVDPGGTVDTKGSYVEISSSAPANFDYLILTTGLNSNTAMPTHTMLWDIAVGSAGNEEVIAEDILIKYTDTEQMAEPVFLPIPVAEGERISIRAQCSITDANDRVKSVVIHGGA